MKCTPPRRRNSSKMSSELLPSGLHPASAVMGRGPSWYRCVAASGRAPLRSSCAASAHGVAATHASRAAAATTSLGTPQCWHSPRVADRSERRRGRLWSRHDPWWRNPQRWRQKPSDLADARSDVRPWRGVSGRAGVRQMRHSRCASRSGTISSRAEGAFGSRAGEPRHRGCTRRFLDRPRCAGQQRTIPFLGRQRDADGRAERRE